MGGVAALLGVPLFRPISLPTFKMKPPPRKGPGKKRHRRLPVPPTPTKFDVWKPRGNFGRPLRCCSTRCTRMRCVAASRVSILESALLQRFLLHPRFRSSKVPLLNSFRSKTALPLSWPQSFRSSNKSSLPKSSAIAVVVCPSTNAPILGRRTLAPSRCIRSFLTHPLSSLLGLGYSKLLCISLIFLGASDSVRLLLHRRPFRGRSHLSSSAYALSVVSPDAAAFGRQ